MATDIAILFGIALWQGLTGYWAFHKSTAPEHRQARWGIVAIACFASGIMTSADAGAPKVTIKPVARTDKTVLGQPIVVPPNAELRAFTVEFDPGARLRIHKHPYPHYVYVEKGTLTVMNAETGQSFKFKQGSFFVEMTNTWHYGINTTNQPVELLVIEQMPKTVATNTVLKPGP